MSKRTPNRTPLSPDLYGYKIILERLRLQNGYTVPEIAEAVGAAKSTYSGYESLSKNYLPDAAIHSRISGFFAGRGISPDLLEIFDRVHAQSVAPALSKRTSLTLPDPANYPPGIGRMMIEILIGQKRPISKFQTEVPRAGGNGVGVKSLSTNDFAEFDGPAGRLLGERFERFLTALKAEPKQEAALRRLFETKHKTQPQRLSSREDIATRAPVTNVWDMVDNHDELAWKERIKKSADRQPRRLSAEELVLEIIHSAEMQKHCPEFFHQLEFGNDSRNR